MLICLRCDCLGERCRNYTYLASSSTLGYFDNYLFLLLEIKRDRERKKEIEKKKNQTKYNSFFNHNIVFHPVNNKRRIISDWNVMTNDISPL